VAFVYFVGGSVVNACLFNEIGINMIPHHTFWSSLYDKIKVCHCVVLIYFFNNFLLIKVYFSRINYVAHQQWHQPMKVYKIFFLNKNKMLMHIVWYLLILIARHVITEFKI